MTKVNPEFIKEMQSELDRKAPEYDGKDNPKYYKNMKLKDLWNLIDRDRSDISIFMTAVDKGIMGVREHIGKKLVAIANRCWMLWEKLNDSTRAK